MLMNLGLTVQVLVASAAPEAPVKSVEILSPLQYLRSIGSGTNLPDYVDSGIHPDAPANIKPGVATVSSPIYFGIDLFKYVVGTIAFVMVIIAAIKLISTANEEEAGKAKTTLLIGLAGLILIQLADTVVKKMFFGEQGEAFEDIGTAELYAEETVSQIRGIVGFIQIFLGTIAVLVIIIRGFTVITSVGSEEALGAAKKHVLYAAMGLIVVGLSEIIIRGFIFPEAGSQLPKIEVAKRLMVNITNYTAGFVAILAFLSLFYSGYEYVTAAGNEEVQAKVKKHFTTATIAIILALAAFALVNTLIKFDQTPEEVTAIYHGLLAARIL